MVIDDKSTAINSLIEAVTAIEKVLGITPYGVYSDIRVRLDILEARINNPNVPSPNVTNPFYIDGYGGTSISVGAGYPTEDRVNGSLYIRRDGLPYEGIYARRNGSWNLLSTNTWIAAGDLSGGYSNQTVIGLQGIQVSSATPDDGYILAYNAGGHIWEPHHPSSGSGPTGPTGPTGADGASGNDGYVDVYTELEIIEGLTGRGQSEAAGNTWKLLYTFPSAANVRVSDLFHIGHGVVLAAVPVVGQYDTLRITKDYGKSWSTILTNSGNSGYFFYWCLYISNGSQDIILVGSNYFYRSTDFGQTWSNFTPLSNAIRKVCYIGNGGVAGKGIIIASGINGQIFRSTDFGVSWPTVKTATGLNPECRGICYLGGGIVLVGGGVNSQGVVWRSTDYGATWTRIDPTTPGGNNSVFFDLAYLGNGIVVSVNETSGYFYRSTDYGVTWARGTFPGSHQGYSIEYAGDGTLVVGGENSHVLKSFDKGLTWVDLGQISSTQALSTSCRMDNGTILLASEDENVADTLYVSNDRSNRFADVSGTASGDLSGSYPAPTVAKLQGNAVISGVPTDGYVLTWVNSSSQWQPKVAVGGVPSGSASGDLSGSYPSPTVAKLQGKAVSSGTPTDGYVLTWNNSSSQWQPKAAAGGAPSGSASGDLSGSYPSPTVAKLQGNSVLSGTPTDGYVLTWVTANSRWESKTASNMVRQLLVSGIQYADVGASIFKVVGSTPTFNPANLGTGTKTHTLYIVGNVPTNSTGKIQLYDVTNTTVLYDSGTLTAGEFDLNASSSPTTVVTLASGNQRLELWIQTINTTGGNMSCLQSALITTFS
jgi:photosystem II stability/assembly factor-like uncharacterized protein